MNIHKKRKQTNKQKPRPKSNKFIEKKTEIAENSDIRLFVMPKEALRG